MPVHSAQQRILNILKELPSEILNEVVDFAEYLKSKGKILKKGKKKTCPSAIPTFHLGHIEKAALDRGTLYGEYLDRKFD